MDTGIHKASAVPENAVDKYTASIELSNACRQFYKSRVEAADCIKTRWEKEAHESRSSTNDNDRSAYDNSNSSHKRPRSAIDDAMDKLRAEMTSLMDQDLSLMKQLLTLNETIEDLKWQRRYYFSSRSSVDLGDSDCSISDTEMYESEDDLLFAPSASTTTATTATSTPTLSSSPSCRKHSLMAYKGEKRCLDSAVVASESTVKIYHSEQDSFDSGIHETCSEEEALEASV